ncbi:DHA2 family multidrug resistance protein-like MFS transporter [Duganella sp. 1224]|uniref:MFS transporter n=1 Tax=Duganella sp. 1224 TaxID=2587052 RepID=UPI0015CA310D|nr:MFS transporter [Duganella sp. 1224]NYE60427.1 DHA2 family multidrug resistance protein-like MFS transporter [Duganella sp. 1224]
MPAGVTRAAGVARDGLAERPRALAMLAVMTAVAMASLDTAIANTALPAIAAQLRATPADAVWIINIYQLAMVSTLLPFAALGDIAGYRRVFIAGLLVFSVASLGCALAWSLPSLVVARLLQGVGASAVMAVTTALMRTIYPAALQGRGFGTNALVVAIAFAVGPTVSSLILAVAAWPWLFAINVPFGLTAWLIARKTVPDSARATHRFDYLAAGYNVAAFGCLVLLVGEGAHGAAPEHWLAELGIAILCFALLLRRQRSHTAPLLPVDLFRNPMFSLSALTAVCTFAVQGAAFVALPFYFEALGRSHIATGFLITPWPVLVAVTAPLAGRLSERHAAGALCGTGLLILCGGVVALIALPAAADDIAIAWRMALCGIGFGLFQAPNMKAIMGSAPAMRAGSASGIVATARLTGQAIGAATVAGCFMLAGAQGPRDALVAAAAFAAVGACASFARLRVRPGFA